MAESKYLYYTIQEDTTLLNLIQEEDSVFTYYDSIGGQLELLRFQVDGLDNNTRIWNKYTLEQQQQYISDRLSNTLSVVNAGTTLVIPTDNANIEPTLIRGRGLFLKQKGFKGFWSKALEYFNNNEEYIDSKKIPDKSGRITVSIKNYNISVWAYSHSLDEVLDITPFIYTCNTATGQGSGKFALTLDPISDLEFMQTSGQTSYFHYNVNSYKDNKGTINIPYFIKNLQKKDLIFIRFEKLDIERRRNFLDKNSLKVNENLLAGQVYDMIGFIDTVSESYNAASDDKIITVSGRDLLGILEDDSSHFFPLVFARGSDVLMFNTDQNNGWFKRNFDDGTLNYNFTYSDRSIKDSIGFVINQLANMGVVRESLFSGYNKNNKEDLSQTRLSQRRDKALKIQGGDEIVNGKSYAKWVDVKGVWQIVDVLVDSELGNRRQNNNQLINSEASLLEHMNNICQPPFVEFFGDTYGDKYVFTARQRPFTKNAILGYINDNTLLEIDLNDVIRHDLNWETEYYSWYQIEPSISGLGYDNQSILAYIPILHLDGFANIFGNNGFIISDSYMPYRSLAGDKKDKLIDDDISSLLNDFIYVIETSAYLPFTRNGSIVLNGDRRIKKNTWVRFNPTGEIFYVDGVSNDISFSRERVDRNTTLQVSRGMVERYVTGKVRSENVIETVDIKPLTNEEIKLKALSKIPTEEGVASADYIEPVTVTPVGIVNYFNIVNTKLIEDLVIKNITSNNIEIAKPTEQTKAKVDVNSYVFNFFLQRKQFK